MEGSGMPSKAAAGLKTYRREYNKYRAAGHSPAQAKAMWKVYKKKHAKKSKKKGGNLVGGKRKTKKKTTKKKTTKKKTTRKRRGRGLVGGEEAMMAKLMTKLMNA